MKVRRYLRGSGRVLAFVFVASVIWLLFDMAALRISINDVNSQLLKDQVKRERELFKQQSRVTHMTQRGFKHPVQGVAAVTHPGKGPLTSSIQLAQVYRHGGKQHIMKGNIVHSDDSKVRPKQRGSANKMAVNLDITQVPPGVQKSKQTSKTGLHTTTQNTPEKMHLKTSEKPKDGIESGTTVSKGEGARPAETTRQQPASEVGQSEREEKQVKDAEKTAVSLRAGDNSIKVRKPGVHKVLSLDMTPAPRDVNALGQFGQAVILGRNEDEEVRRRWDEGYFNVYLSDRIPVDRAVPDTRPEM